MKKQIIQVSIFEKSIESLKEETNQKTASKALIKAASSYQRNIDMIATRDDEIRRLKSKIDHYEGLLYDLSKATSDIQSIVDNLDI